MTDYRVVLVTVPNQAQAEHLTKRLIESKLAACVNQVSGIHSTYWWEGKVETGEEHLLIIKTRSGLIEPLIHTIRTHHAYSVPEVIALPILAGNPDYLRWIDEVTSPA